MTRLALTVLATSSVSMAAVLLGGPWLRSRAGARVAYACWLLPWAGVMAAMLPFGGALTIFASTPGRLVGALALFVVRLDHAAEQPVSRVIVIAWGLMTTLFLVFQLAAYRGFIRSSSRHAIELGRAGATRILSGPHVPTPVATGILHRRIFLPANFPDVFSLDEQRMILRHEQAHHDRLDIAANLMGLVMLSLHWWNPLAHGAHRRFRADQELACDATAVVGLDHVERHAYATAILKCAGRRHTGLAAALGGRTEAAARLSAIASNAPLTPRVTLPTAVVVTLLGSFVLADGAAMRALSSPTLLVAEASPRPGRSPPPTPNAMSGDEPWRSGWRPVSERPSLAGFRFDGLSPTRLILARLDASGAARGPTSPA